MAKHAKYIDTAWYQQIYRKLQSFVKENRTAVRLSGVVAMIIVSLAVAFVSCGVTFALKVDYGNEDIATIKTASVFNSAKSLALKEVSGANSKNLKIKKPKYSLTITFKDKLTGKKDLAEMIINRTDNVVYAHTLYINGKKTAVIDNFDLENYVERHRTKYFIEGAVNSASFADEVKVKKGYCFASKTDDLDEVIDIVDNLKVTTKSTVTSDVVVPFKVVTNKTNKQVVGYSEVKVPGINGITRTVESLVRVNGEIVEQVCLSSEVITNPVNQVVLVGTAKSLVTSKQKQAAARAGFYLPLPKGSYTISAYFGDGRGHKGIDMAAKKGTSIFAAKEGKVIFAGSYGGYGNCVFIDHGSGIVTRYAHASSLLVTTGETVEAGQVIARVGTTGQSTGNHLHFEVVVNGTNYDPAPYIGIY